MASLGRLEARCLDATSDTFNNFIVHPKIKKAKCSIYYETYEDAHQKETIT